MSGVKRFNMTGMWDYEENSSGRWVESSDYDRLEQECARWRAIALDKGNLAIEAVAKRNAALKQVEAMRVDAERWNKLKSNVMGGSMGLPDGWICADEKDEWGQIVDGLPAALQAKP